MQDPDWKSVTALIPHLRGYAIALIRSSADADDLVQETLSRAWRYRNSYVPGSNLKAWLFRILRNCFNSEFVRRRPIVQDVEGRIAAQLIQAPEQEWFVRYREMLDALALLSETCREALLLVVASGLSYEEAAVITGAAVGTVKSRVNRARRHLSILLDEDPPHQIPPARTSAQHHR